MEDYDEYDPTNAYFASLQGPSVYGTHQASQRLRGPARREQTFTFAATPPGSRNRQTSQRNSRPTYWIDDQPVLHDLVDGLDVIRSFAAKPNSSARSFTNQRDRRSCTIHPLTSRGQGVLVVSTNPSWRNLLRKVEGKSQGSATFAIAVNEIEGYFMVTIHVWLPFL